MNRIGNNLRILHAWGGSGRAGLYQQIAIHCGLTPRDYLYGRSKYGMDEAFEGVCAEFLSATAIPHRHLCMMRFS